MALGGLFGVENTGPLLAFLPVITIGLLFGLAIDYELFLMTRVHEEYSKTGDNDHSIRVGIESGPVIVLRINYVQRIAFVFKKIQQLNQWVFPAFGVLFDAFIVRMTLIPALQIFGKGSWYIPKWLGSVLPKIDIEGKTLDQDHSNTKVLKTRNMVIIMVKVIDMTLIATMMITVITIVTVTTMQTLIMR